MKTVIKYWRLDGIRVIMYLDDGLGMANSYFGCLSLSTRLRSDLEKFGFMIAHDKSDWNSRKVAK